MITDLLNSTKLDERSVAMTGRVELCYSNLLIDTEKAISELLNLYSNDGPQRLMFICLLQSAIVMAGYSGEGVLVARRHEHDEVSPGQDPASDAL